MAIFLFKNKMVLLLVVSAEKQKVSTQIDLLSLRFWVAMFYLLTFRFQWMSTRISVHTTRIREHTTTISVHTTRISEHTLLG